MTLSNSIIPARLAAAVAGLLALSACAPGPTPQGITDPNEAANREIHEFNKAVDNALLRPAARGYGSVLPEPLERGIGNLAANLDAPGQIVNGLLQGRPDRVIENTARFVLNSTIGLAGLFDPATAIGLTGTPTDFGETLHVWGVGEGNYVELPLSGPSTERDMVGMAVDAAINPLRFLLPRREAAAATVIGLMSSVGDRSQYSETVDSILYDSADSYAQLRLLYLQNRRYELGQTGGDEDFFDPYEDPYAE